MEFWELKEKKNLSDLIPFYYKWVENHKMIYSKGLFVQLFFQYLDDTLKSSTSESFSL